MSKQTNWLIENVNLATFADGHNGYGEIENGIVEISHGKIQYAGNAQQWNGSTDDFRKIDANGQWLTPGLIDCHTHLVFAGNRAEEFERRLNGESYESIANSGGGILSTVRDTRALSEAELFEQSAARLERLLEEGVTTVEIKSGYGLDIETELKMLRVAKALEKSYPVTIKTTFLGAHAVAPEFKNADDSKQAYIDYVCEHMLPAIAETGLADAVDVFCEGIGFSVIQCEQVYRVATNLQLPIKAHVEQLSNLQGAVSAASFGALSVDHIEYLATDDVESLKNTVAVLLPAAFYCLNETQKPPVHTLRDQGIAMAVASDLNPGTAPVASLLTAINQACVLFALTPQEALAGATRHAAKALGLSNKGQIVTGLDADLVLWDIQHPAELAYGINLHRPKLIWQGGNVVGGAAHLSADKNYAS